MIIELKCPISNALTQCISNVQQLPIGYWTAIELTSLQLLLTLFTFNKCNKR